MNEPRYPQDVTSPTPSQVLGSSPASDGTPTAPEPTMQHVEALRSVREGSVHHHRFLREAADFIERSLSAPVEATTTVDEAVEATIEFERAVAAFYRDSNNGDVVDRMVAARANLVNRMVASRPVGAAPAAPSESRPCGAEVHYFDYDATTCRCGAARQAQFKVAAPQPAGERPDENKPSDDVNALEWAAEALEHRGYSTLPAALRRIAASRSSGEREPTLPTLDEMLQQVDTIDSNAYNRYHGRSTQRTKDDLRRIYAALASPPTREETPPDALLKRGDAWKAFAEHMSGCTHCTGGNYEECVIGEPLQSAAEAWDKRALGSGQRISSEAK